MYWKKLRAYVIELIVFLLITVGLFIFFTITESIVFKWSAVLVLFLIMLGIWLVQYAFSFIPFALLVATDLIFKNYSTVNAKFVEQFIFKSSSFLDKNGRHCNKGGVERIETLFYKVNVKTNDGIETFTSSEYYELQPNTSYEFVFGRKSKALVDVRGVVKG